MKEKKRLDQRVREEYSGLSRNFIQSLIMQGKVKVNDKVETKSGAQVASDATILVDLTEPKFVSRAGFKLEKALDEFGINVEGLVAMDAGL